MTDSYITQTRGFGAARRPSKVGPQNYAYGISPQLAPRSVTPQEKQAYADYQSCTDVSPEPARMTEDKDGRK